ncbi:MAG: threonine dehydratase [Pseudomonadales bacterium]|nr:threonine dehydratase [Pseudomonadales bacterium]
MSLFSLTTLEQAAALVYQHMPPTPQYEWPQLSGHLGTTLWVKHENHTATGAFKIRGGITFMNWLSQTEPDCRGIITATRGNHGQSQARAAKAFGLEAHIVVPHGNAREKNGAMQAFGANLIEHGSDFDAAKQEAMNRASAANLVMVPPYHREIEVGVATYALELFNAIRDLDVVYVPIGCGSGVCGLVQTRDILKLKTRIVGVVSTEADAAKQSFEAGHLIETKSAHTFADGMAVRAPIPEAFAIYSRGVDHMVAVTDEEVAQAIRLYFACTHNVAEGAGAAALAAALQEKAQLQGQKVGVILTGGNIDTEVMSAILRREPV